MGIKNILVFVVPGQLPTGKKEDKGTGSEDVVKTERDRLFSPRLPDGSRDKLKSDRDSVFKTTTTDRSRVKGSRDKLFGTSPDSDRSKIKSLRDKTFKTSPSNRKGLKTKRDQVFKTGKPLDRKTLNRDRDRAFGPFPSTTTKLGWARIDNLSLVKADDSTGFYVSTQKGVVGKFAIDHETGNIYYFPPPGQKDNPDTKEDESKPAGAIFKNNGTKEIEKWLTVPAVPPRVTNAAKLNLIRTPDGTYKNRDTKDTTIYYLQDNGTFYTPDRRDPSSGASLGPATFNGDKWLTDGDNVKPRKGTLDKVTLRLHQTGDNEYKQVGTNGHFELGSDGLFHYKGTESPTGSKIKGPQYYDSSDPNTTKHKWKAESPKTPPPKN